MRPHHSPQTAEVAEVKPQKAEVLTSFQVDSAALFIIDFDLQFGELLPQSLVHCSNQPVMTFVGVDQDHQVVSEPRVFDIGVLAVASDFPRSLQHLVHLIEVEIAEQGRDHAALRNALLARGLEHKFQQMHDVLVVDPLSHFLQQPVMPDIVKVGSQIKVEDPRLPLSYCFRHSLDRVVCCPLGPISIRPRLEVRLKHRFEDELERTLHHSVPDRRDRNDAAFAPVFRYLLLPGWEWVVGAPGQFVAKLLEQSLHAMRLDGLERDPVYSRGPIVIASLPSLRWRHCKWQGPFAPWTLLRFLAPPDPAVTLSSSADFPVSPVIRPTLLRLFRAGTRRASPVAWHVLVTVLSLPPRRGEHPYRSVFGCSCGLRPPVEGSALGDTHFRGHNAFTVVTAR